MVDQDRKHRPILPAHNLGVRLLRFDLQASRRIEEWGNRGVLAAPMLRVPTGPAEIHFLRYQPNAVLGRHPTGRPQLFAVVEGGGWVSGPDESRHPIEAGQAAFWSRGESHESGTTTGMTVIVVQAETLEPG